MRLVITGILALIILIIICAFSEHSEEQPVQPGLVTTFESGSRQATPDTITGRKDYFINSCAPEQAAHSQMLR